MAYSSTFSTLATPQPTDRLNNPSHSQLHQDENAAILEIERTVGLDSSIIGTVIGDLRNPASNGGGHIQTAVKGGTGQTTFIKGDILAATSASVLSKLAVGIDGLVLTADSSAAAGVKWGVGVAPTVRVYATTSVTSTGIPSFVGIWNKPSNLSYIIVETIGAGGGGGGTTTATEGVAGGGGGGYSKKTIGAASLPIAASVIVGIGGHGGIATGTSLGSVGGITRFGSILSATGGSGGNGRGGGAGGVGASGDFNVFGNPGVNTIIDSDVANAVGGNGGGTVYGGGGQGANVDGSGNAGGNYGGGGGGAASGGADRGGGDGADGVIIITEY